MKKSGNNFAFIDSQNLNLGIRDLGWELDFQRFRKYLKEKYTVTKAYIFIGYVPGNEALYTDLQKMINLSDFEKAVIVSGDGDFYCLVEYLLQKDKLEMVLVPDEKNYSALLKKLSKPEKNIFEFLNRKKSKLELK